MNIETRLELIRQAHQRELAKRGQVETSIDEDLEQVDETEAHDVPTSEKLKGILKATNGNSRGDFFEQVDGDEN